MHRRFLSLLLVLALVSCNAPVINPPASVQPVALPSHTPALPTFTPTPVLSATPQILALQIDSTVPETIRNGLHLPGLVKLAVEGQKADARLEILPAQVDSTAEATWFYALVAPFATIIDSVTLNNIRQA
jgi:hypothetical protein